MNEFGVSKDFKTDCPNYVKTQNFKGSKNTHWNAKATHRAGGDIFV